MIDNLKEASPSVAGQLVDLQVYSDSHGGVDGTRFQVAMGWTVPCHVCSHGIFQ